MSNSLTVIYVQRTEGLIPTGTEVGAASNFASALKGRAVVVGAFEEGSMFYDYETGTNKTELSIPVQGDFETTIKEVTKLAAERGYIVNTAPSEEYAALRIIDNTSMKAIEANYQLPSGMYLVDAEDDTLDFAPAETDFYSNAGEHLVDGNDAPKKPARGNLMAQNVTSVSINLR